LHAGGFKVNVRFCNDLKQQIHGGKFKIMLLAMHKNEKAALN